MTQLLPSVDAGLVLSGLLASLAVGVLARQLGPQLLRMSTWTWLGAHRSRLRRELLFVRAGVSAETLLWAQLALAGIAGLFVTTDLRVTVVLGALAALPGPLLRSARRRRVSQLEAQIEAWLGALARSLEAAPSLGEALEVTVAMSDAPMREELKVLVNEVHLGRPLGHALDKWGRRVGSRTLNLALSTLQVGRESGGRLGGVLKSTAASLREMERLEGVVRTKTAEGKVQAAVISVVPLPLYGAVKFSDPTYFVPLETTPTGNLLLAIAVGLWLAAGLVARKVLAVQI